MTGLSLSGLVNSCYSCVASNTLNSSSKKEAISHYLQKQKELKPHNPFFVQTCHTIYNANGAMILTDNLFHVFSSWQDGLLTICDMLKFGSINHHGKRFQVTSVFEQAMFPNSSICSLLCDYEMSSAYREEGKLLGSAELFPSYLHARMLELGILDVMDVVEAVFKCKTRQVEDGSTKLSYHFILNIAGFKEDQNAALGMCMQGLEFGGASLSDLGKQIKSRKRYPDDIAVEDPVAVMLPIDLRASMNNGISMIGSRKRNTDPYAFLEKTQVLCLGKVWREEPCPIALPHNLQGHISDKELLWVMYQTCYTVPKNCSVSYNIDNLVPTVI